MVEIPIWFLVISIIACSIIALSVVVFLITLLIYAKAPDDKGWSDDYQ